MNVTNIYPKRPRPWLSVVRSQLKDKLAGVLKPKLLGTFDSPIDGLDGRLDVAGAPMQQQRVQTAAKPNLSPDDVFQLANASPKDIRIPEPEKSEESSTSDADSITALPAGIELPAGMTIDQLPPQALKAMSSGLG